MYESMLTFPGSLFGDFERLRRELDTAFGSPGRPSSIRSVAAGSFPAINIGNAPGSVDIYAFAPGLDPSKIEVVVDRGVLRISGERPATEIGKATVYACERPSGRFERAVSLPDDVDAAHVRATYRDGVLQVSLPRSEAAQPKRIVIQ